MDCYFYQNFFSSTDDGDFPWCWFAPQGRRPQQTDFLQVNPKALADGLPAVVVFFEGVESAVGAVVEAAGVLSEPAVEGGVDLLFNLGGDGRLHAFVGGEEGDAVVDEAQQAELLARQQVRGQQPATLSRHVIR